VHRCGEDPTLFVFEHAQSGQSRCLQCPVGTSGVATSWYDPFTYRTYQASNGDSAFCMPGDALEAQNYSCLRYECAFGLLAISLHACGVTHVLCDGHPLCCVCSLHPQLFRFQPANEG